MYTSNVARTAGFILDSSPSSSCISLALAFLTAALAVAAFVWAVQNGQFEDLEGEAERILFDDEPGLERKAIQSRHEGDTWK